jgi:hypothetical protein
MKPTAEQLLIMRHALGISEDETVFPSVFKRNHYCAAKGYPPMVGLIEMSMVDCGRKINEGRDQYFHVNTKGQKAVYESMHGE